MKKFNTLKDLPAAKVSFKRLGWAVESAKMRLNGRPAFVITEPADQGGHSHTVTDYGLLEWANEA